MLEMSGVDFDKTKLRTKTTGAKQPAIAARA